MYEESIELGESNLPRVLLLHWNEEEAGERVHLLRSGGFEAGKVPLEMPTAFRQLKVNPPDAVVIDLSRLPSAGRDVGLSLRTFKATRRVPMVFVGGDSEKLGRIKRLLPDAVYTTWDHIQPSLKQAIAHPPIEPVVPKSRLEGYSGTPIARKLGIRKGSVVSLVDAPPGFKKLLGERPENVAIHNRPRSGSDVAVWFVRSTKDLETRVQRMVPLASKGALWIGWPKKASAMKTDLSQVVVRRAGLNAGMVDFKISSFDETWSGLRFTSRRSRGQGSRSNTSRK